MEIIKNLVILLVALSGGFSLNAAIIKNNTSARFIVTTFEENTSAPGGYKQITDVAVPSNSSSVEVFCSRLVFFSAIKAPANTSLPTVFFPLAKAYFIKEAILDSCNYILDTDTITIDLFNGTLDPKTQHVSFSTPDVKKQAITCVITWPGGAFDEKSQILHDFIANWVPNVTNLVSVESSKE